ncbi:MAG: hypothetical protein ACJ72L_13320 [Marmoricola sp.]
MGVAETAALISIQLRTPADQLIDSPVLDTAVIVGLALPVAVLGRTAEDRMAWLLATSSRQLYLIRTAWVLVLYSAGGLVAAVLAFTAPGQQPAQLIFADEMLLLSLAVISAVLFSAQLCWLLPVAAALAISSPGLIPLRVNWPVLADHARAVSAIDIFMLALGGTAYIIWDDYGLSPLRRLVARTPGVTDE